MARKNELKNDSNRISFNPRTKTVMADVVQVNIKEKVSAVREVVSGKSNNEIVLVLQYYDNDVEKVIQAYLEDGAKEALTEWHFSETKSIRKKRNKKKNQSTPPQTDTQHTPESVTTSPLVNGDAKEHLLNGDVGINGTDGPKGIPNGHMSPVLNIANNTSINANARENQETPVLSHPHVPTLTSPKPEGSEVKVKGKENRLKEKSPSPLPQRQHHDNKHRTHSGSHSSDHRNRTSSTSSTGDGKPGKKGSHLHVISQQTVHLPMHPGISQPVLHNILSKPLTAFSHRINTLHVLERSSKDLYRQTVSLDRLRLVFNEEVDKSYKRIKSVFDELRHCLHKREEELMGEMNSVKDIGRDTFNMRQGLAADLKVKIDRADRLSDTELAELRHEIKNFVSDRKIDEDLGRMTRFFYGDDKLKADIAQLGEVIQVKCIYIQRHPSLSSIDSGAPSEPEPHHVQKSVDSAKSNVKEEKNANIPHLDSTQTHEVAELQRRLKHSLTLEGIPVETFPDRPISMPVPERNSSIANDTNRPNTANSRNNRNRGGRGRGRGGGPSNNQDRRSNADNGGPNRGFIQGADGERIILIGKGTRPQSGPGRPPRGAGGRGGGGFRGRGGRGRGDARSPPAESRGDGEEAHKTENTAAASKDGKSSSISNNENLGKDAKPLPRRNNNENRNRRNNSGSPRKQPNVNSPNRGSGDGNNRGSPAGLESKKKESPAVTETI